jgi:hypothetical protein
MEFSSPRITAFGKTPQFFPIVTLPMMTAFGAMKLDLWIFGIKAQSPLS